MVWDIFCYKLELLKSLPQVNSWGWKSVLSKQPCHSLRGLMGWTYLECWQLRGHAAIHSAKEKTSSKEMVTDKKKGKNTQSSSKDSLDFIGHNPPLKWKSQVIPEHAAGMKLILDGLDDTICDTIPNNTHPWLFDPFIFPCGNHPQTTLWKKQQYLCKLLLCEQAN